jgi:hypothetical protein
MKKKMLQIRTLFLICKQKSLKNYFADKNIVPYLQIKKSYFFFSYLHFELGIKTLSEGLSERETHSLDIV